MGDRQSWHDQDRFWELFESILFDEQRLINAKVEFERVINLLNIQKDEKILDLCCGIGRHSLEAARQGFNVVGVDRTASFIDKAKQIATVEKLDVEFLVADMKEYCQPNSFDIVINMFGSFGYFEDANDDRQVVKNMYKSLRSAGRFLVETNGKEITAREFRARDWFEHGNKLVLAEREPIQSWSRIKTRWIVIEGGNRFEHVVSVHSYAAEELRSLFADTGFLNCQVYGSLEGRTYDHEAERLVVVGTK